MDPTLYENWHTALSSVYAIYLITDKVSGKQYVGSAYGTGGLLGRWKNYVETHHGGNKRIVELLQQQQVWQADFQHTLYLPDPLNPKKRKKAMLFAIIDDALWKALKRIICLKGLQQLLA